MNTTNPQPGAGPNWPADVQYGSAPDDSAGGGGINPAAIRAGHEPDAFQVKPIMSIPLAVVVTFVIAFTVAAGTFAYFNAPPPKDPFVHPAAVARSEEKTNERLERIERGGLRANDKREVDQPRLEPLKRLDGDGLYYARPPLPTGNSPEIHPEDILPDRVAALQTSGLNDDKHYAHIPIAEAMKLAVSEKMFPVRKGSSKPIGTVDRPSASNGGVGIQPPLPK